MADRKDITINETAIAGASGSTIGRTIRVGGCDKVSVSFSVTVSAATLQGSLLVGGTNDDQRAYDAVFPIAAVLGTNSLLPTGITYSATTGVFTFNNPSIGTSEVVIVYPSFPKYLRPTYTFTSGGGTVSVTAVVAGWSS